MTPHFGSRVSGHEAYDKAVREEKGGANVFGVRVRGAITGNGPVAEAKRATEHGVRVLDGAQFTNTKGEPADALSIEEIQKGLTENPTFFDSWYEGELAREDGPRPEALRIFREVEKGIKGAGRREILDEIAALLGETSQTAARNADLGRAQREQVARQLQREDENRLLDDAGRVKALRERDDNLQALKDSDNESTKSQIVSSDVGTQVSQIADEQGLDLTGGASTAGASEGPGAKPEGTINPGTQQPASDASSVPEGDAAADDSEEDEPSEEELKNSTIEDLKTYLGDEASEVKGKDGERPVKKDYLRAAKKKARKARG